MTSDVDRLWKLVQKKAAWRHATCCVMHTKADVAVFMLTGNAPCYCFYWARRRLVEYERYGEKLVSNWLRATIQEVDNAPR